MKFDGNCLTTAMGILPHNSFSEAFKIAFSVDIPFWPQLPRYSFYEDMYVQISENFPGIRIDEDKLKIWVDTEGFYEELANYAAQSGEDEFFKISDKFSAPFYEFLKAEVKEYKYIRGQSIGPISFGLKVTDENMRPIIYNDEIRDFLFEFIAQKVNVQYRQLKEIHPTPFVWVDEPGLEMLFTSFTGYTGSQAKKDFLDFLNRLETPKGVHLCGNPDWSFLLSGLDLDILSVDIFGNGEIFTRYVGEIDNFLKNGGIISWGITPTLTEEIETEGIRELTSRLEDYWLYLNNKGVDMDLIASQAWLAPARCCLVNNDGGRTVEKSFELLNQVAGRLKEKYILSKQF